MHQRDLVCSRLFYLENQGMCISCPGIGNLLVCEGGQRAVTRYKKLLLRRIKWKEGDDDAHLALESTKEGVEARIGHHDRARVLHVAEHLIIIHAYAPTLSKLHCILI